MHLSLSKVLKGHCTQTRRATQKAMNAITKHRIEYQIIEKEAKTENIMEKFQRNIK